MTNHPINPRTLAQLFEMINRGQASRALPEIQEILSRAPRDPNVLHLAALTHAALNNEDQAIRFFDAALKSNPKQPEVHNNFANYLKNIGRVDSAKSHYKQATSLQPRFSDAWRNLAILEYQENALDAALAHANKANEIKPNQASILTLLGNIYRKLEKLDEALDFFKRAIALHPDYVNALYGMAITYSARDESNEALPLLDRALRLKPGSADIQYSLALALLNLGEVRRAEITLQSVLRDHPLYIDAHRTLNELFWQHGNQSDFCKSYRDIPSHLSRDINIAIAHVEDLIAANRIEEAEKTLVAGWRDSEDPRIKFLRGRVQEEYGDMRSAISLYEQALQQHPDLSAAKQLSIALIKTGQFAQAEELIESYTQTAVNDQLLWALRGTCWKVMGDERYHWLTRENAFIQRFEIPVPDGFSSINEFLTQLKDMLIGLHNLKEQPLTQSVRGGTQSPGRFLYKREPIVQALRKAFSTVVGEYIEAMPFDSDHPLLRRKSKSFRFSGSWSVALGNGGHHVSHVHPAGWISSAFYVSLPKLPDSQQSAGDIYFGQSPYALGERDPIEKQISPKEGTLVLFPSFTWHGTIPTVESQNELRLTTPFDAVPEPERKGK